MKINISDATITQINWLVAKKLGMVDLDIQLGPLGTSKRVVVDEFGYCYDMVTGIQWEPTSNPAQAHPIIDRECIGVIPSQSEYDNEPGLRLENWCGRLYQRGETQPVLGHGPTPLIAAMRCFVNTDSGDVVDVPDDLC